MFGSALIDHPGSDVGWYVTDGARLYQWILEHAAKTGADQLGGDDLQGQCLRLMVVVHRLDYVSDIVIDGLGVEGSGPATASIFETCHRHDRRGPARIERSDALANLRWRHNAATASMLPGPRRTL